MWIWLILSLLLVIACIIFGIHSFLSSRTLQRSISVEPVNKKIIQSQFVEPGFHVFQQQEFSSLKNKLKFIEGNSAQQTHQLNELLRRIEVLEEGSNFKDDEETKWREDDEDWEKLYYETKKEKESLEAKLDLVNQTLYDTKIKLEETEKQKAALAEMKTGIEGRLAAAGLVRVVLYHTT